MIEKLVESVQTLSDAFAAQARRTPTALALTWRDLTLTYAELNRRANRLARHLRALGVGAESLVGVCQHRSPDLIVSLLAVLKAGGAYVPLAGLHLGLFRSVGLRDLRPLESRRPGDPAGQAAAALPEVEDCVAVAREDGRGVRHLVAYVVAGPQ